MNRKSFLVFLILFFVLFEIPKAFSQLVSGSRRCLITAIASSGAFGGSGTAPGGLMTDWGAHHMDVIHWALGEDEPKAVAAVGGRLVLKDNRETLDSFGANFEYPAFMTRHTKRNGRGIRPQGRSYGTTSYGTWAR